jgi:hypothetical protein
VRLEHVRDPRAEFYVATIHRDEDGVHRYWGVVGDSKETALSAASRFIEELMALHGELPGPRPSKGAGTQVA